MKIFITGILGMVGSSAALRFAKEGHEVYGIDNGFREDILHASSDDSVQKKLEKNGIAVKDIDIVDITTDDLNEPDVVIHTAAQPSHEFSIDHDQIDFYINAKGTLKLLDAIIKLKNKPIVIYTSTIKVYGDVVNQFEYQEGKLRYFLDDPEAFDETLSIDGDGHSPFGVSKLCADLYCQEYINLHKLDIGIFRLGCITGPTHRGVELHGFLSYLVQCGMTKTKYNIFGNGKQVRDQIHVDDLIDAFAEFIDDPKPGVYNLGGGIENSISILEAIDWLQTDHDIKVDYRHDTARFGDHLYWVTDNTKFERNYPSWSIKKNITDILESIISSYQK